MIVVFALLGLFVGSFLNVCIDRLPRHQSIIHPGSHCDNCNNNLNFWDLFPIISYLWLRGKCRYCQTHIPRRIPIVEGITGLLFAMLSWKFGLSLELGISLFYASLLIIIFVIDLENQLVLDKITYPSMILALIFSFFWPGMEELISFPTEIIDRLLSSLAGGAIGLLAMALPYVIYRRGMGFGDVKLGTLVGLMTGFPLVFVAILMSWIMGGIVAALLLALKVKSLKDPIPSATFLAISTMVTLLWGSAIWQWYLW
ncbi:MAG: prepilin peptidase [Dehalococcoidales bacterium]|nr:prepilin peptidase [Dehalococcoidales bacterium]